MSATGTQTRTIDVAISGSGPAGLFTALELSRLRPKLKITIFEKGPDRKQRTEDNLTSGLGGAGAFSDGKLTLPNSKYPKSLEVGGRLASIIGEERFLQIVDRVDRIYSEFGGRLNIYEDGKDKQIKELVEKAADFDLELIPTRVRHFGSDLSPKIIRNITKELRKRGVEILVDASVETITQTGGKLSNRDFLL